MLTKYEEETTAQTQPSSSNGSNNTIEFTTNETKSVMKKSRLARVMSVEWLGQTAASLCWIASVFTYGISSTGDWLQLFAASAWLLANIASVSTTAD